MKPGKFIVIEGGDGAGKDTQIDLLRKDLGDSDFVYTREPGGTKLGKVLRDMLLHASHGELPLLTEVFLFLADRSQHVEEVVLPSLRAGKTVISNRSWVSMVAFQIYGRDRHDLAPMIESAIATIYKECPLDLAVILDITPEVGQERQLKAGKTPDIMESMTYEARKNIQQGFLEMSKKVPSAVIDANRSIEEVYKGVKTAVDEVLKS